MTSGVLQFSVRNLGVIETPLVIDTSNFDNAAICLSMVRFEWVSLLDKYSRSIGCKGLYIPNTSPLISEVSSTKSIVSYHNFSMLRVYKKFLRLQGFFSLKKYGMQVFQFLKLLFLNEGDSISFKNMFLFHQIVRFL